MKALSTGMILIAAGLLTLAGCATPQSQELNQAQQSYSAAQADPTVSKEASATLYEAKLALEQAESAENIDAQRHYAYLAEKKIELAQVQSNQAELDNEIADLKTQQEEFLMALHQRQAQGAQLEAEQAKSELEAYQAQEKASQLESARKEAQQAQSELEQLRQEVADMQTRSTDAGVVLTLTDVVFEYDKADLKTGAERGLGRLSNFLQQNPQRQVLIEGFTDSRGSEQYNQQLSERRAEAVAQALIADGIASDRITTRGHGEQYPIATNDTDAGRQKNRRVEITILNADRNADDAGRNNDPA
jgi:outer membrane protein OmpA-like peptidoglycan-associated protein